MMKMAYKRKYFFCSPFHQDWSLVFTFGLATTLKLVSKWPLLHKCKRGTDHIVEIAKIYFQHYSAEIPSNQRNRFYTAGCFISRF